VPRYIVIKQEKDFPMTPTAQIKKYEMREMREIAKKKLGLDCIFSSFEGGTAQRNKAIRERIMTRCSLYSLLMLAGLAAGDELLRHVLAGMAEKLAKLMLLVAIGPRYY